MSKCQLCKTDPAEWAMQYIGEDTPTFTTLGSHYRGFRVTKVCDHCKQSLAWRLEYDAEERARATQSPEFAAPETGAMEY